MATIALPDSCTVFTKFRPRVIVLRLLVPGWDHGSVLWEAYGGYIRRKIAGDGLSNFKRIFQNFGEMSPCMFIRTVLLNGIHLQF